MALQTIFLLRWLHPSVEDHQFSLHSLASQSNLPFSCHLTCRPHLGNHLSTFTPSSCFQFFIFIPASSVHPCQYFCHETSHNPPHIFSPYFTYNFLSIFLYFFSEYVPWLEADDYDNGLLFLFRLVFLLPSFF